jgi:hypothetical protein
MDYYAAISRIVRLWQARPEYLIADVRASLRPIYRFRCSCSRARALGKLFALPLRGRDCGGFDIRGFPGFNNEVWGIRHRIQNVPPKSTSLVMTVPALRPGAVW